MNVDIHVKFLIVIKLRMFDRF